MIPVRLFGGYLQDAWKHPKLQRAALAASVFAFLDLLILVVFWMPAAWGHYQLEKAIEENRSARLKAAHSREAVESYARLSHLAGIFEDKWKTPVTQAGLVESLTRSATRHRLRVLSQNFDVKNLPDGGMVFEQNLSLSGNYESLRDFLGGLDDLPNLTVVRQARLEREGEAGAKVRATLLVLTYQKSPGGT